MKAPSTYKMSKDVKRMLMVTPKENVPFMKDLFIGAELAEARAKQAKIRDNNKPDLEE